VPIVSRKFVGSSVLVLVSLGLALASLVLWPSPVSLMLSGLFLLCGFGALLVFCRAAGREYARQAQRAIFLVSGCFGLAFIGLAWKYRESAPALSSASLIATAMLSLRALATVLIVRSIGERKASLNS
jgi:hypothetical protein